MTEAITEATPTTALPFSAAVPGAVLEETPNGLVVAPDKLVELATYLRDQQGYSYLSMVTSVDWPQYFEVVYYLYNVPQPDSAGQSTGDDLARGGGDVA